MGDNMKKCGIYKITNLINGKCYIGQSVDIYDRWRKETAPSAKTYSLQRAFQKYNVKNFNFEIIEEVPYTQLNEREQYWIDYYDSYEHGYNETRGGDGQLKYNYEEIYKLYLDGYNCKEIQDILHCDDCVVTRALRCNDISEEEVRGRNNCNPAIAVVTLDPETKEPLRIFKTKIEAIKFLNLPQAQVKQIQKAVKTKRRAFGYYWEDLCEANKPLYNYSDEEILNRQKLETCLSIEHKQKLSNKLKTVERPSREELKKLIRSMPFLTIGKLYGVSDNAIRNWCDAENLPRKKNQINKYSDLEWEKI